MSTNTESINIGPQAKADDSIEINSLRLYCEHLERLIVKISSLSVDVIEIARNGVDVSSFEQDYEKIKLFEDVVIESRDFVSSNK